MHPSLYFRETDRQRLFALIRERGFALIGAARESAPVVAHAPVRLRNGALDFHLSAASAVTEALRSGSRALAVVSLDDAYVSPDWYLAQNQVPTWNYRVVEAEGPVQPMSRGDLVSLLDALSAEHEARLAPKPAWSRVKMDQGVFERMLSGIVGFTMKLERLEGTLKLSQNKPAEERARVAEALEARADPGSQSIARAMRASIAKPSSSD